MKFIYRAVFISISLTPLTVLAQDLTIALGATVTIESGSYIASGGNLSNSGTLTLGADANGYSQIKVDGTVTNTGTITQSQYLTNDGYASISSPMTTDFATTSGDNTKMFYYDGSAFAWRTSDQAGRGYFASIGTSVFATSAGTFSATGTPNTSMTHSLSYTVNAAANGSGTGWNLVGNPYTCGLDWTAMTKTNVNDAFYVWDPSTSLYKYYSSGAISGTYLSSSNTLTAIIPPMQAVWVQSTANSATLVSTMADDGTLLNAPTYISKTVPDNLIVGIVAEKDSSINDAFWLINSADTKNGFDGQFDAWKMENGSGKPNISSTFDGQEFAINALDLDSTNIVPIAFNGPEGLKYFISLEQMVSAGQYKVTLEDKYKDLFWDIVTDDYSFKHSGWNSEDPRFYLHFELSQALSDNEIYNDLNNPDYFTYQDLNYLYVNQSELRLFNEYSVFSLDGRLLDSGNINNQLQSIPAPYSNGIYLLTLKGDNRFEKIKFNIVR